MISSPLLRLLAILFSMLTFSMLTFASPVKVNNGFTTRNIRAFGHNTSNDLVKIFEVLKEDLQPKLQELNDSYANNADPSGTITAIATRMSDCVSEIKNLNLSPTVLTATGITESANLVIAIMNQITATMRPLAGSNTLASSFPELYSSTSLLGDAATRLSAEFQAVLGQLQQSIMGVLQQAIGQLENLIGSIGG
ncbi:unnamed protein product [Rhizoctonia solani]|uniref:Uncharacterized protein n=1 Tax=Rhizoctonia solani TaxID=456999 RepID=A0A8H3BH77_9AGAM|nr:unnamed protein product [Rhizoctonia solani]